MKKEKKSEELKNWKLGQNWKIGQHQNCKSDKIEIVSNWKFAKFGQDWKVGQNWKIKKLKHEKNCKSDNIKI